MGINGWTMQRWLQNHRAEGQPREAFHHVEVLASTKAALVLRGACGVSVEGLSVEQLAKLLRELSCSA
ncbi:MAG: hypothetical protein IPJ65_04100 [Archangiaceae bacterium]|nr:hypothetical protein [Archangiaceae bacterium]